MEDYTRSKILQKIEDLKSEKGVCEEADRMADEQISLYKEVLAHIEEVKS